jgi:hypothetical protein
MNSLGRLAGEGPASECLSSETRNSYVEIVLKAVEDKVTKGVDIAGRTDVTARQVLDALRLVQQVRFWGDWPVEFSRLEIAVISRGIRQSMLDQPMSPACVRPGRLAIKTFAGIPGKETTD